MSFKKKIKKKIKYHLICVFLLFKNYKISNAIVICSEARGGSTWLMELLGNIPNSIINWEPLHVNKGVIKPSLNLGWRPYVPRDNKEKIYIELFRKILTLKIYNQWTLRYVQWVHLKKSKYVISKFVRLNQSLPWLVNQFPYLKHKPIFLLRHPITTCISRLKTFENNPDYPSFTKKKVLGEFIVPKCLNNERYLLNKIYIEKLETQLEREVAIWCVNNSNILAHPDSDKWITVYYEDLVLNPRNELSLILKKMNLGIPSSILENIDYRKASASDYHNLLNKDPSDQLESFLQHLDKQYLQKLQNILNHYKVKTYSAFDAYPLRNE